MGIPFAGGFSSKVVEWLKTEQTVLILSGNDLVITHKNMHCCSKQKNCWCRAVSKAVQILLLGRISPSLSGCQTWNIQANLVFSLQSVVIDFKLCQSLSVGDNPNWMPAPESLLQVQEQSPFPRAPPPALPGCSPQVCTAAG